MSEPNPHHKPVKSDAAITNVYNVTNPGWASVIGVFVFFLWWMAGIVLAKGFWSTLFTVIFFPYALYLVVERVLQMFGVV